MSIHALTERAMVVNLSIGRWQGTRLDKAESARVTKEAGADSDAARVNKHLVPREAIAPINKAMNAIRAHFYENTLPWRDNLDRLMTRKCYLDFIPEHEKLVGEFTAAVDHFVDKAYPAAVEQAEFRMGTMFDRDDYPHGGDLRRRFYCRMEIAPVPTSGDFRVEIDQEHVDKIRKDMEAAAEQRIQNAMGDVWRRLAETVGYFFDRMNDPDAVFRDSTINNIAELVEIIPGLNVLDDPDIERVRQMVQSRLTGLDPKDIRGDAAHRAELAGEAKNILDTMNGFVKAFGGETP